MLVNIYYEMESLNSQWEGEKRLCLKYKELDENGIVVKDDQRAESKS